MADRGGQKALSVLLLMCASAACLFMVWWLLPNWLVRPNAEATTGQYQDAGEISGTEYTTGKCPALRMATAKALIDKKLTASEAHDLKNQAYEMAKASTRASAKNRALESAGLKPTEREIDCPYGLSLFAF